MCFVVVKINQRLFALGCSLKSKEATTKLIKNQKSSLLYERDNDREKYIGKTLYENLCKTIT